MLLYYLSNGLFMCIKSAHFPNKMLGIFKMTSFVQNFLLKQ